MIDIKTEEELKQVSCIWYLMTFNKQTGALLDSRSIVNTINQVFAYQLGLKTLKTYIRAQKIDDTFLTIYGIVVFFFSVLDKNERKSFFEKSFLLANFKPDIVLGMLFLTMSNTDVDF